MTAEKIIRAITTTDGRTLIAQPDGTYREVKGETDWAALDAMTEAEIEQRASEDMAELRIDPLDGSCHGDCPPRQGAYYRQTRP